MEAASPVNVTVSGRAVRHGQLEQGYYLSSPEVCDCGRLGIAAVAGRLESGPCRDEHTEQANLRIGSALLLEIVTVVQPGFPASTSANVVVGRHCNLYKDCW